MNKMLNDTEFAEQVFRHLGSAPIPRTLEERIMADYSALMARPGLRDRVRTALQTAFPGIRPWQPALAFALALMIGGIGGTLLSATGPVQATQVVQTADDSETYTDNGLGTALSMAGEM